MKEFIEKLLGRLEKEKYTKAELFTYDEEDMGKMIFRNKGVDKAIEIVNQLAEEYNNGWISVKERLPTEEGSYLVIGKTGGARVMRWYAPSKYHPNGHFGGNGAGYIRYWMPRPKAPIREEEG